MIPTPVLLATLASLLSLAKAAPLPNNGAAPVAVPVAADPTTGGRPIKWASPDGQELCLQVNAVADGGSPLFNGASVGIGLECFPEGSDFFPLQQWVYELGSTSICLAPNELSDTTFCIDFGTNLGANGQALKIWQQYQGLAAQSLYITDDQHISVENGPGQCADVQEESQTRPPIFIFDDSPVPPVPVSGQPIQWVRESDGAELCLQVDAITGTLEQQLRNGAPLTIGECFAADSDFAPFQSWDYTLGSTKICLAPNAYSDTQFCIDFGTNLGANGQTLYIWQAYDVPQQRLYITDDLHVAVENGPGSCMDVRAESGPQPAIARPWGSEKSVQSWECTFANTNQIFEFTT